MIPVRVIDHLHLVPRVLRATPGLSTYRDRDGLQGAGNLALVEAATAYKPHLGVPFEAYARLRIRGAMLDEIRTNRYGGRSAWEQWAEIRDARAELSSELNRPATVADVAAKLGWSTNRVRYVADRYDRVQLRPLDRLLEMGLQLPAVEDPTRRYDDMETLAILATAIGQLKPRLQLVIEALFFADQRQQEVAATLGVTESRISQMLAEAIRTLRATVIPELVG